MAVADRNDEPHAPVAQPLGFDPWAVPVARVRAAIAGALASGALHRASYYADVVLARMGYKCT